MLPSLRSMLASFVLVISVARAAISIDGSKAVDPVTKDDPSPIIGFPTCPLTDSSAAKDPMLLQLSVSQPLDRLDSTAIIRSCTLGSNSTSAREGSQAPMENPKKSPKLFQGGSLKTAAACSVDGDPVNVTLALRASSAKADGVKVANLLDGIQSVYTGTGLGKPIAKSAIQVLSKHFQSSNSHREHMVAELCSSEHQKEQVFGVSIDYSGDLAAVQNDPLQWSKGSCAIQGDLNPTKELSGVNMFDIVGMKSFSGDSCAALAARCNIRGNDFLKFNPQKNLCATLKEDDYVCCSAGDPYKPEPPKPEKDGTCATHLIKDGDSCAALAKKYAVTVQDLEKFNKGKTWAWTGCNDILIGYNMCLGPGTAPMPPPQEGAECGPLVPGTKKPTDKSISLADLNPCPLKACCSNWGFCGVFPGHCTDNSPEGSGPGTKKKGFQNTCVSNCGNKIKQNSGPPAEFQRIARHQEGKGEWADFKKLKAKRIVSFSGWANSTEPGKYDIIRSAITNNRDVFATNLASWANEEGIDGIDIDWEYPGAPDIIVGGKPIGQKRDGLDYLRFLTVLRQKLDLKKLMSIAAPALYWYLKAFSIDKIAEVVDYIVYMTYDLHGQWDHGNPNAFDQCDSGKASAVMVINLTETNNALSMIIKAGVPNNKVFVGEASYGRFFHMARDNCWKPDCEFTGSKTKCDVSPGRCTKAGGYLAFTEIMELLRKGSSGIRAFHDDDSESDIVL
ncbi:hypothetical protein B0J13DRAFT_631257 [Dactylonectria estremocensis]|uniref:chitinase n=1 Tax=Dactylonectria estremocensis TaxID=1079267 RepID=A0A9P9D5M6_9HYPO|nr:hypothetical protein B0J13DRAFT_631257 [Dactylonectria estremocensis]